MEIIENLLPGGFTEEFPVAMGHIAAVAVPVLQGCAVVGVVVHRLPQCPEHHVLVVAQDQLCIGHCHEPPEDPQTTRMAVDDIAKNKECIPGLQVDLLQNGMEPPLVAVDI